MRIVKEDSVKIDEVVSVLQNGGLVIYPTETLYGAGVDATNPKAVTKLNHYKKRPAGKPYSVAVSDIQMAKRYAVINSTAKRIYDTFLPGPVTIISKGKGVVAKGIESETGTLGIRIPDYKLILEIIKKLGKPITTTSANASYKKRPYKISDILNSISKKQKSLIDLIIDAGTLPFNEPSTVIDTTSDDSPVLRQGNEVIKNSKYVLSKSPEETQNTAKNLFQKYEGYIGKRALVFALSGEMGVGKTVFTKGLAKAMGINEIVTSPTFNLQNSYKRKGTSEKLIHIDTWRMFCPSEMEDLGFSKNISDKSVVAIEWAEKIVDEIRRYKEDAVIVWVKIEFGKLESERKISWEVTN